MDDPSYSESFPQASRPEIELTSSHKPELPESSTEANLYDPEVVAGRESDSDMSDLESPEEDFMEEEPVVEEEEKEGTTQEKGKRKKRKKHDPSKRRKIRKLFTEEKLNTDTLEAIRREEERRKRLEQSRIAQQTKQKFEIPSPDLASSHNQFPSSLPQPMGISAAATYLTSLLTSKEDAQAVPQHEQLVPEPDKETSQLPPPEPQQDVICISSDSEDEKESSPSRPKSDMIDISSDSSDDVICTGEVGEEEAGLQDVNNSGMHIEDAKNQRDSQGRVLVNVSRPTSEPEIFLAPQLASAILPHQIGGVRFMYDNIVETISHFDTSPGFGCILAHAMGLGKTLQVISFIDIFLRHTKARTALVVVPVNTLMNWVSEFNMWLPPKSKCLDSNPAAVWPRAFSVHILSDNHKTVETRSKVVSQWYDEGGVLLLGYEMYRQLASRKQRKRRPRKKSPKPNEPIDVEEEDRLLNLATGMQASLLKPGPDLIVCDEGHRIKNSHASISKMLKLVRTRRRIVLTGYPLQNNLLEYWCMVDFVRPNFLGTKQEFSNMFERPILNGQCADSNESDVKLMRFRSHVLHSLLKGFVQRRSHSVLRQTLPHKEEHVFLLRLSEWQKKLYNTFWQKNMKGSSGSWCSNINPIKAFSVCIKIWNHPDVLYQAVQERQEENNGLDPDFDVPDSLDPAISGKKIRQKSPSSNSLTALLNGDSSSITASEDIFPITQPTAPVSALPTPGFIPFSDDKERRMSLEWANDILSGYTDGMVELSGKMVVLMRLINLSVSMGDRILVFSQSLSTLSLIEGFLAQQYVPRRSSEDPTRKWSKNESYLRLDGNTHSSEREKMINQFNSDQNKHIHLFLLSTRAGCLGINLIGANRVVVFDASWNPCHDAQAVCRVYRYGQQKTCHIYRLVCDQAMEKKIYERQITKQGMSDRVVDKLNPTQVFTKQDVLSLMEYSDVELPRVDFENVDQEFNDPVLVEVCKSIGHWFTKKPFTHESLLLDCKDQRLTKAEKRLAEKGYEKDKMASSAYNYGRQSYAGFYGSSGKSNASNNAGSDFLPTSLPHDQNRPIANVRPMQSTPVPMQFPSNNNQSATVNKAGITVQRVVATMDIPLPPQHTTTNTMAGEQPKKIHAGDTICVIRGRKGTYIRTSQGRIFAVRLNDSSRFTSAQSEPVTRLSQASSMTPSATVLPPPSSNSNSINNSAPAPWIDLSTTTNRRSVTSSSSFSSGSEPQGGTVRSYNSTPVMSYANQYAGTSSFTSMPIMSASTGSYPTSAFNSQNSLYDQNTLSNAAASSLSDTLYSDDTSTSAIGQSRSYNSLSSANQMSSMDPTPFATNQSPLYSSPFSTNQNPLFSGTDPFDFSKQDSPLVNTDATMRMSYSTPNFFNSQDSAPMDLSNPYSNPSFSNTPVPSQRGTPQSSFDDDGGLNFAIPPFGSNW